MRMESKVIHLPQFGDKWLQTWQSATYLHTHWNYWHLLSPLRSNIKDSSMDRWWVLTSIILCSVIIVILVYACKLGLIFYHKPNPICCLPAVVYEYDWFQVNGIKWQSGTVHVISQRRNMNSLLGFRYKSSLPQSNQFTSVLIKHNTDNTDSNHRKSDTLLEFVVF